MLDCSTSYDAIMTIGYRGTITGVGYHRVSPLDLILNYFHARLFLGMCSEPGDYKRMDLLSGLMELIFLLTLRCTQNLILR